MGKMLTFHKCQTNAAKVSVACNPTALGRRQQEQTTRDSESAGQLHVDPNDAANVLSMAEDQKP